MLNLAKHQMVSNPPNQNHNHHLTLCTILCRYKNPDDGKLFICGKCYELNRKGKKRICQANDNSVLYYYPPGNRVPPTTAAEADTQSSVSVDCLLNLDGDDKGVV